MPPACPTPESTTCPYNDGHELHGASVDKSTTEVGGSFSVRTNLWLTLKKLDSTEELHSAVVNLAGLQVLHVLGPELPLAQGRKIHRTAVATMTGNGHLYRSGTEVGGNTMLRLLQVGTRIFFSVSPFGVPRRPTVKNPKIPFDA